MEAKHLSGWKIFENKRGGFYLHKKHRDLINDSIRNAKPLIL
jgi:hypothetical protein